MNLQFFNRTNSRITILLLLLAVHFELSWSLALNCTYGTQTFAPIGSMYTCEAGVLNDEGDDDTVTWIYGTHLAGKTHSDVHGFVIQSEGLKFIPKNVESFFPNIRALDVYDNLITSISNFQLRPFAHLVHFAAIDNEITSLDSDLFAGLPFLSYVSFSNNSIRHVGHDFLMPSLGKIYFDSNDCISYIAENATQIDKLRFDLLLKCPPTISLIEGTLEGRPNMLTNVNNEVQSLAARVALLEAEIELILRSKIGIDIN